MSYRKENINQMDNSWDYPAIAGAIIVLIVLFSLILTVVDGWPWFAKFLESAAPAWVQAVGSIMAIIAALHIVKQQHQQEISRRRDAERDEHRRRIRTIRTIFMTAANTCENISRKVGRPNVYWPLEAAKIRETRNRLLAIDPMLVPDASLLYIIEEVLAGLYLGGQLLEELQQKRSKHTESIISGAIMKTAKECWLGFYEATDLEIKMSQGKDVDLNRPIFSDFAESRKDLEEIREKVFNDKFDASKVQAP